jgi:hypothetical protein
VTVFRVWDDLQTAGQDTVDSPNKIFSSLSHIIKSRTSPFTSFQANLHQTATEKRMSDEQHDEFFGGAGGGLQFMGVLNALRTGDPMVDMIIAMCFPALIRFVFDGIHRLLNSFLSFDFKLNGNEHERRIIHKTSLNGYGGRETDEDSQNTVLIKAINLYLHHQVKLKLQEAHVDLTSTEDKNASVGRSSHYHYDYYDSPDHGNDDEDSKTVVGALSKYRIVQKPPPNQWHNLGEYGEGKFVAPVRLQIEKIEDQRNDGNGQ